MSCTRVYTTLLLILISFSNVTHLSGQSIMRQTVPMYNSGLSTPGLPTSFNEKKDKVSPKLATIMSAVLPGLGQIYNEKYWKVGIIYIAGFAMGYGMKYNVDSLKQYQKALNSRIDTSSSTIDVWYPLLTDAKVTDERDYYRRNRDMLILGFVGLYALQIIDANVDAHLKEFEINKDLALKLTPEVGISSRNKLQTTLSVRLRF